VNVARVSLALTLVVAGCGGGAHEAGPVPTAPASKPSSASHESTSATPTGPAPGAAPSTSTQSIALCEDRTAAVAVASREGAAGTISTLWRVTNGAQEPCRSIGYPGMDFHTSSGWLDVQVHRGGYPNIDHPPAQVVLSPGQSLYFVSYWGDVDTSAGPCVDFDRVKVTLPDNFVSARLKSSGCLDPQSVRVGPVAASPPS
jgi:Protein of unknown function (DUF4232)